MFKAKRFGIRIAAFLLCVLMATGFAAPASAAMVKLELETTGRLAANVYYSASTGGTVIGCLEDGTELTVIGEKKDFYRIDCYGVKGYIAMEQVRQDENGFYYVNCPEGSDLNRVLRVCSVEEAESLRSSIVSLGKSLLGVRYVANGTTPKGFDCSGFTRYVFRKTGNYILGHNATTQMADGVIVDPDDLQPGDLVIFKNTYNSGKIASHVGIYIGDGKFVHASNSGIKIDDMNASYYVSHFLCARRVILTGNASYESFFSSPYSVYRSSGPLGRGFSVPFACLTA